MTWIELSRDSLEAAGLLQQQRRWRSCVSRAYYAVYARLTARLTEDGTTFPPDREGPSHDDLPDMAFDHLTRLTTVDRNRMPTTIRRLYEWRVMADYRPVRTVAEAEARTSMIAADWCLKVVHAAYA